MRPLSVAIVTAALIGSSHSIAIAETSLNEASAIHYDYHSGMVKYCRVLTLDVSYSGALELRSECERPRTGSFSGQLTEPERSTFFAVATTLDWSHPAANHRLQDDASYELRVDYAGDIRSTRLTSAAGDFAHLIRMLEEIVDDDARWTKHRAER